MKFYEVYMQDAWHGSNDRDYHTWYFIDKAKADEIMKREETDMAHNYFLYEHETED